MHDVIVETGEDRTLARRGVIDQAADWLDRGAHEAGESE
jgi:hypothetical protein